MSLSNKEIHDLNNMNVAAQNVQLGTLLNDLINGGGGSGLNWINLDSLTSSQKDRLIKLLESFKTEV